MTTTGTSRPNFWGYFAATLFAGYQLWLLAGGAFSGVAQ